jgi:RNA polymerase sigma factor (sigma-70 family)
MTAPDDLAGLLAAAADGDQRAWDQIVDRFTNLLWSIGRAHRLDTSSINDVIQTTWLRLLENIHTIRDPDRLAGWLATTARRECLAMLRRSGRESPGLDAEDVITIPDDSAPPVDRRLLLEERDLELWQCFSRLSDQCQSLLRVLMEVEPASYAEISSSLDLPIGSIGPTRMRCLRKLRDIVHDTGYTFEPASGGS